MELIQGKHGNIRVFTFHYFSNWELMNNMIKVFHKWYRVSHLWKYTSEYVYGSMGYRKTIPIPQNPLAFKGTRRPGAVPADAEDKP